MILAGDRCSGCTACVAICPTKCIQMMPDSEGFLYPDVNEKECIDCGKCEEICPVKKTKEADEGPIPKAYALVSNDEQIRRQSSSGGAFSLLAENVLLDGGVVFGAVMSDDCRSVHHAYASTIEELAAMRGSKYLQSDLQDSFLRVKELLGQGRKTLFSGTPCQVEGLKAFLGKDDQNLLCVDLICHGVPSAALWGKYVEYCEKQQGELAGEARFRVKGQSWRRCELQLFFPTTTTTTTTSSFHGNPFMKMFLGDLCLRPSCYQCCSKELNRVSDLTIADFWGVESVAPDLDDDMGTSLVLIHSDKGKDALSGVLSRAKVREVDCLDAIAHNPSMLKSCARPKERDSFYVDVAKMSFSRLRKRYVSESRRRKSLSIRRIKSLCKQTRNWLMRVSK